MQPKEIHHGKLLVLPVSDYTLVRELIRKKGTMTIERVDVNRGYNSDEWEEVVAYIVSPIERAAEEEMCVDTEKATTYTVWDEPYVRFARERNHPKLLADSKFFTDSDYELITKGVIKPNDELRYTYDGIDIKIVEVLKGQEQIIYENMCLNLQLGEFRRYEPKSLGNIIHWLRALGLINYDSTQIGYNNDRGTVDLHGTRIATFDFDENDMIVFKFIDKYDFLQRKQDVFRAAMNLYPDPYLRIEM